MRQRPMPKEQLFIGVVVALLCAAGLVNARWFLVNTRKGKWLARRCGDERALWLMRGLFGTGTLFGVLLACDMIGPVHW